MHNTQYHWLIAGGGYAGVEDNVPPVVRGTQTGHKQAPVATAIRIGRESVEGLHQAPVIRQPLVPDSGLGRVPPNFIQIPQRQPEKLDGHAVRLFDAGFRLVIQRI